MTESTNAPIPQPQPLGGDEKTARQQLLRLLEAEINLIRAKKRKHSWAHWATLAVFVFSVYLINQTLIQGDADLFNVNLIFVALALLIDNIWLFRQLLKKQPAPDQFVEAWRFNRRAAENHSYLVFNLLRHLGLITIIALEIPSPLHFSQICAAYAAYIFVALSSAIRLLLQHCRLYNFKIFYGTLSQVRPSAVWWTVFALRVWALLGFIYFFIADPATPSILDWRAGILLSIASYTLLSVAGLLKDYQNMLEAMLGIFQELTFSKITPQGALRELEIITRGLQRK